MFNVSSIWHLLIDSIFINMQNLLDAFIRAESGVLLSIDTKFMHSHEGKCDQMLVLKSTTSRFPRRVGLFKRKSVLSRMAPWTEVCIDPMNNPLGLPVLFPFVSGEHTGAKADLQDLIQRLFHSVGGGSVACVQVRWFVGTIRTPWVDPAPLRSYLTREVLVAVGLFGGHSSRDPKRHEDFTEHLPHVARVSGMARRTVDFRWLR
jgi:hypothetical protein